MKTASTIECVTGLNTKQSDKYKLSRYNVFHKEGDAEYVWNTYSNALLKLDERGRNYIKTFSGYSDESEEFVTLRNNGFVVYNELNEIGRVCPSATAIKVYALLQLLFKFLVCEFDFRVEKFLCDFTTLGMAFGLNCLFFHSFLFAEFPQRFFGLLFVFEGDCDFLSCGFFHCDSSFLDLVFYIKKQPLLAIALIIYLVMMWGRGL